MKVVDEIFNQLLGRKSFLESQMHEIVDRRENARKDGDLSENADYIKACSELEECNIKYQNIMRIIDNGFPVPTTTIFSTIDIGCKFKLRVSVKVPESNIEELEKNHGCFKMKVNSNSIVSDAIVTIAGDIEEYLLDGYISSECAVSRCLIGKPLGTYKTYNNEGELLILEAVSV